MLSPSPASSVDVEVLLDRFLSASTATDCLDSLEQLQVQCRRRRPPATSSSSQRGGGGGGGDPKAKRPSQQADQLIEERRREEDEEEERQATAVDTLLRNASALRALCGLVSSSTLPRANTAPPRVGGMEVEGGDVAACELLSAVLSPPSAPASAASVVVGAAAGGTTTEELRRGQRQKRRAEHISKTLLHFHDAVGADGVADAVHALTPSLLDCLCASSSSSSSSSSSASDSPAAPTSVYARVLSLQILQSLLTASPGTLREQLMMAPDGINRLVDLLGHGPSMGGRGEDDANSIPEEVRNESVLFLTSLASSSPMLARLITFSEGYDRSLKIALECSSSLSPPPYGGSGLSSGSTVAMDCLELCLALAHGDEVARELFMGGGDGQGNLDRLARLVDLRGAERYRDKERNAWWEKEHGMKRRKEKNLGTGKEDVVAVEGSEGTQPVESATRRGGKRGKKSKDDDLDDILRGASSTTSAPDKSNAVQQSKQSQQDRAKTTEPEGQPTPYLTPNEARIVDSVFNLILVLLRDGDENTSSTATNRSKRRGRAKSIMSHDLARYIVDCALYTPPPPGVDYVSGVPPPALQQKALLTMGVLGSLGDTIISEEDAAKAAKKLESDGDRAASAKAVALRKMETEEEFKIQTKLLFETMPIYLHGWVTAIDRLMYLCCTGAYAPKFNTDDDDSDFDNDDERPEVVASLLSTYSISTFRSCLHPETASRMVLHALAPPPPDETDEMDAPLDPPVVTRLVTTFVDNVRFFQTQQQRHDGKIEGAPLDIIDVYRATIGASGSAGALGVFLTRGEGDANREMLLRLSPPLPLDGLLQSEPSSANLIDFILQHIATYDPDAKSNIRLHASSAYITMVLLKLLSEWVIGMPRAVMEVLSSPSSVSMGVLLRSKKVGDSSSEAVSALCGLLLGLCLEYMLDPGDGAGGSLSANEVPDMENIAWTKETIMNMVQSMGVGKYLNMIDEWKKRPLPLPYCEGEERSNMEKRAFASWYSHNVTLVRRRVVMALAEHRGDDSDESDAEGPSHDAGVNGKSSSSIRALQKMMSSQAQEIENLQIKLEDALLTITSQSTQIRELKRVTELGGTSAETIDMMTEYTEKMAELEKIKGELKKDAENQTRLQEEAIAAKDREIVVVREELLESRNCIEEIRSDNETLKEEMAGLSSAYNMLELQFHQTISGNNSTVTLTEMTAGGETAAEDGGARDHSSGEAAAEIFGRSNNSEVQFLRDENARLREEGRAANEWMSMAVSKMDDMSGENESLARSLEEALANLTSTGSSDTDSLSIQHHLEVKSLRKESKAKLKTKDDEIAKQQALVQQLEDRIEEIKFSIQSNDDTSSPQFEELQQIIARQEAELESVRQANVEAQDWMASAVTHVDKLTKEVQEKDEQLEEIANSRQASEDASNNKITELESSLKDVISELNESLKNQAKITLEMGELQTENADLLKRIGDDRAQELSKNEALTAELDQVKLEKVTLEASLNQFQSWSETAQSHLAEVEAKLKEATSKRDDLMTREKSSASGVNEASSQDYSQLLESLQKELDEKNDQLARMQDQLIEDADENEAKINQLLDDCEAEKQRVEGLSNEKSSLSAAVEKLSLEKEHLSRTLSEKQSLIDSTNASNDDAGMRVEEAQRRISDLEAALCASEAKVHSLMAESSASGGNGASSQDYSQLLESLQKELDEKNEQLERMQDQLIDDADENEAKINQLLDDCEAEKQRAEGLSQEKSSLSTAVEKLSLEKERLSRTLSEKQSLIDSTNAGNNDAGMRVEEAQRRISDLEAALCASESQVHSLMALKEQITTITAERDEMQSQLNHISEEYEKNQLLEHDNISLQNQLSELERKISEKENEKSTMQNELNEFKTFIDDSVQLWQKRTQSLEADVTSLENQLAQQENDAAEAIAQWESRCSTLEETISEETVQLWQERIQSLEANVTSLENQLEQQENEAAEAIAQWESRCSTLDETEGRVIRQWEERVQSLESDITSLEHRLEQQVKEAADAITHWEARCSALGESEGVVIRQCEERVHLLESNVAALENQLHQKEKEALESHAMFSEAEKSLTATKDEFKIFSQQTLALESTVAMMTSQIEVLNKENEEKYESIECMKLQIHNKDASLAKSDKQLSELANELLETQQQSELVVIQWQERSEQLESNIDELEHTIEEMKIGSEQNVQMWQERAETQEKEAAEVITQWEARCVTLNERLDTLELQLAASEADSTVAGLKTEVTYLTVELEVHKGNNEKMQKHIQESKELFDQCSSEWKEKEARFTATIEQLEISFSDQQKKLEEDATSLDDLKNMCAALQDKNGKLLQEIKDTIKEKEESQVVLMELKEELRHTNEQLQSFATDQFTRKATEMATQALRQQMEEIRSRYSADQEALLSEIDARRSAEEEVERLKSDLALLSQATEYDDSVDVHVRKTAKKMSAENVKAERKEMEQLRTTVERLREELGSCRWNERQSEEKAANARLQMSILEQEITAAKNDLELMEQALEDLETSKINMSVSLEYRIEVLENERLWTERSHEEEVHGIKAELAESNEERDNLAHKLEQSEKVNAALVYSTAHNGPGGEESESEVIKLQLERAQLLAKISEMGTNLERRVREAIAAQVSSSEAELIVEKQSRHSVEASLSEALAELKEVNIQLADFTSITRSGALPDSDQTQGLKESLDDMRTRYDKLLTKNQILEVKWDAIDKENKSTIKDLRDRLNKAEEDLRSHERESRFEAALAAELDNVRASSRTASNGTPGHSQALVLKGMDQNMQCKYTEHNSAYVIEMYDYVCELKSSIVEERTLYKELLAEHEDLLALLGQAGLDGIQ